MDSYPHLYNSEIRVWHRRRHRTNNFLMSNLHLLKPGRILDAACGDGCNALAIAHLGLKYKVQGLDLSSESIKTAQEKAKNQNIDVNFSVWDLTTLELPHSSYDSIVVTRYWQRDLIDLLCSVLTLGGVILYETYTLDFLRYRKRNPRHLLKSGELLEAFKSYKDFKYFRVLKYEEEDLPASRESSARIVIKKVL